MANPQWPPTFPQDAFLGQSFQRRNAFAQFSVDAGPSMRRRVFGNASTDVRSPMIFTQEQMIDFDEFWIDTLFEGSLAFDWVHPVTGVLATYRFNTYPSFSKMESAEGKLYQAVMDLELIQVVD